MVKSLNISGQTTVHQLHTLNSTVERETMVIQLNVSSRSNATSLVMKNVIVVDSIPVNSASCDVTRYTHLEDLFCAGNVIVDVLIGQDHPVILRPLETRYGSDTEPFAVRSILGWTLNGPITSQRTSKHVTSNFISAASIEHKLDDCGIWNNPLRRRVHVLMMNVL